MTRGFTSAEVALCLIILAMMTVLFAAVFPMAIRGAQYSSNYAQASMIAQHKMDQLRTAGYGRLDLTDLQNLSIVNGQNADGSFDFTAVDNLVSNGTAQGYFPPGSIGTLTITDDTTSGIPSGTMAYVTVTVAWTNSTVAAGSYRLSSIISKAGQP